MNKEQPQAIKDVIGIILEELKGKEPEQKMRLVEEWEKAVRPNIAKHTKPINWRDTCLIVNVDSSSYLYELNLQKRKILSRLKRRLGKEKISEIQFRIGEII